MLWDNNEEPEAKLSFKASHPDISETKSLVKLLYSLHFTIIFVFSVKLTIKNCKSIIKIMYYYIMLEFIFHLIKFL